MEVLTITSGGISAKVYPRTPRRDLYYDSHLQRMYAWYQAVALELNLPVSVIDTALTTWARVAARCEVTGADGVLPALTDTPDEVRAKFMAYLDSPYAVFFDQLEDAMKRQDTPIDPVTAPKPLADDAKKKTESAA